MEKPLRWRLYKYPKEINYILKAFRADLKYSGEIEGEALHVIEIAIYQYDEYYRKLKIWPKKERPKRRINYGKKKKKEKDD